MVRIKVLIIGKYGFMMNHLILRLNREKCDVYTISGKHSKEKSKNLPAHTIFEFDFDSMAVNYIMECVKPDVVIFMGAQGDYYDWDNYMTSSRYMADLTNVLTWAKANMVRRFLYLSSMELYEGDYEGAITEETEPDVTQFKNQTIYNGECVCKQFQDKSMSVTVLRLPFVYGPAYSENEKLNIFVKMCFSAKRYGKIQASGYGTYMVIYVSDAVDAVYKAASAQTTKRLLYHINGTGNVTDEGIRELLEKTISMPVEIAGGETSERKVCLDGAVFEQEFRYAPFIKLETGMERTVRYVEEHYEQLQERELQEREGIKREHRENVKKDFQNILNGVKKIVENITLFAIMLLITIELSSVEMFESVDFMLFYVLIIALNFGVGQSAFAAVMGTMGNIFLRMQETGLGFTLIFSQYTIILRFLFYFISAIMISYKSLRKNAVLREREEQLQEIQQEYTMIYEMNKTNIELKKVFEERLLNYGDSIGKIYNIISELEVLDPEKIETASLGVVRKIMNAKDVCIYKDGGEGYYHFIGATTEDAKVLKRSVKISDYEEMQQVLQAGDIYINHNVGDDLPRMAAPIFFDDRVIYIIMLWNMEFEQLNTYQKTLFLVLAKLITSSLKKGYQYAEAERRVNYYPNTDIMVPKVFNQRISEKLDVTSGERAEYTMVQVDVENRTMEDISRQLSLLLRDGDKIGKLDDSDTCLHILVHANHDELSFVINRLSKNGINCRAVI